MIVKTVLISILQFKAIYTFLSYFSGYWNSHCFTHDVLFELRTIRSYNFTLNIYKLAININ